MCIKNLKRVNEVRFKIKTRLLHLGNVENPTHSQLSGRVRVNSKSKLDTTSQTKSEPHRNSEPKPDHKTKPKPNLELDP